MPEIVAGVRLVPPKQAGDCECTFCGLYRAGHYVRRAVVVTALVAVLALVTVAIDDSMHARHAAAGDIAAVVGTLSIAVVAACVLALAAWYRPVRRLAHCRRPR